MLSASGLRLQDVYRACNNYTVLSCRHVIGLQATWSFTSRLTAVLLVRIVAAVVDVVTDVSRVDAFVPRWTASIIGLALKRCYRTVNDNQDRTIFQVSASTLVQ